VKKARERFPMGEVRVQRLEVLFQIRLACKGAFQRSCNFQVAPSDGRLCERKMCQRKIWTQLDALLSA